MLSHIANGDTNRAIVRQLRVREATVKTHLVHLFVKLDVDRTAAVTTAISRGILRMRD